MSVTMALSGLCMKQGNSDAEDWTLTFTTEESTYTSINFTCEDLVKKEHMDFKRNLTRPLSGIRMFFCESMKLNSPRENCEAADGLEHC